MDRFRDILRWSGQLGVGEITLLGGEPSLHPLFPDMVRLAAGQMSVRVVTNGARRFQRLLADDVIDPGNLARVAVSLDSLDECAQDDLRGSGAYRDAVTTIDALQNRDVVVDVNVTAVTSVLDGLEKLIDFADRTGCRRVNIHWPSAMGLGRGLDPGQIPSRDQWEALTRWVRSRVEARADFFVEVERGFLSEGESLSACAVADFSNLQLLPDGRAYRCGLLVDRLEMASLSLTHAGLRLTGAVDGEEQLRKHVPSCDGCPALPAEGRACIYDKLRSASPR